MKLSLKLSVAVHVLMVTHFFGDSGRVTGKLLTLSTGSNPVIVRSIVRSLKNAGILTVPRGPKSHTKLLKAPESVSLWDVFEAVDPESMNKLVNGVHTCSSQICPVGKRIFEVLNIPYRKIAGVIEKEMRAITLGELCRHISLEEIEPHKEVLKKLPKK
jgi:DNA-binding IscR family transcriptional regulator